MMTMLFCSVLTHSKFFSMFCGFLESLDLILYHYYTLIVIMYLVINERVSISIKFNWVTKTMETSKMKYPFVRNQGYQIHDNGGEVKCQNQALISQSWTRKTTTEKSENKIAKNLAKETKRNTVRFIGIYGSYFSFSHMLGCRVMFNLSKLVAFFFPSFSFFDIIYC